MVTVWGKSCATLLSSRPACAPAPGAGQWQPANVWPWSPQQTRSFTADVRAKPEYHKFLIGKGGGKIRKVRDTTGARIIFPAAEDKEQDLITIMGKEDAVREAQKELEALIQNLVRPGRAEPPPPAPPGTAGGPLTALPLPQRHRTTWSKTACWWTPSTTATLSSGEARSCARSLRSTAG